MKLVKSLSPKRFFRSNKDKYAPSKSDPPSFGSGTSSSSSSDDSSNHKPGEEKRNAGSVTPTSVLPGTSREWSDFSADVQLELVEAFKLIDRDNDGIVSRNELEALLNRLAGSSSSQEVVSMMLSEVDQEGNGCISVETLMSRVGSACGPACDSELRDAFDVFDSDHDGKITAEELHTVFTTIGDDRCTLEDCRRMIEGVAKNGDGFVCFEDFSRMMELQRLS
ncbi:hypothetical protein UlMin_006156 [Ulmus minor]